MSDPGSVASSICDAEGVEGLNNIESGMFAMVIDVVGAHDGSELVIHGMADLLAHGTFGDIVSNKALGDLMARELFAECKVGCTISEVAIAIAMYRVKG